MTTAGKNDVGLGQAFLVEQCSCPKEFEGTSCETCASGFYKHPTISGRCLQCNCNQLSKSCDPITGICLNCLDFSSGNECESCVDGYYRSKSNKCEPCPCNPSKTPGFFSSCNYEESTGVRCNRCPQGYQGLRCHQCAPQYQIDVSSLTFNCKLVEEEICDNRGSLGYDKKLRRCLCKRHATGSKCSNCSQGSFYLNSFSPDGCISCFCNGVSNICSSSNHYLSTIRSSFDISDDGFVLFGYDKQQRIDYSINNQFNRITFSDFNLLPKDNYYWYLPNKFLGNKISSYGGFLNYTVIQLYGLDESSNHLPDIEISGNRLTLTYSATVLTEFSNMEATNFSIPFFEKYWRKSTDRSPASREDLITVLSKLEYILVKAQYGYDVIEASLKDVIMDVAVDYKTDFGHALLVEQCVCPPAYKGLSCESCNEGYQRTYERISGKFICQSCNCHGHSYTCDHHSGACQNCEHNTIGDHCEVCAPGYYGNAQDGTPYDCQPCPCPLTDPRNRFSDSCRVDRNGEVECTSCARGYEGKRCERCILGYHGDPMKPGSMCELKDILPDPVCKCDFRGIVADTNCDPWSLTCSCKSNVEGRDCGRCKVNYFGLDADYDGGCRKCDCMGVTDKCTESNYYWNYIEPDYLQNEFTMTTRRLLPISVLINTDEFKKEVSIQRLNIIERGRESLYWSLPSSFTGNKINSYGGKLSFEISFTTARIQNVYSDVDLEIISGENHFYLFLSPLPQPNQINRYEIYLLETSFLSIEGKRINRKTFLFALSRITSILIRCSFANPTDISTLRHVSMQMAGPYDYLGDGLIALQVEKCYCPTGYIGLSCEQCDDGFYKVEKGEASFSCISCNCNGFSNSCHPITNACLNCSGNTEGTACENCVKGFYGNPANGVTCQKCPCFECELDVDGGPRCTYCPPNYFGRICDRFDDSKALIVSVVPERSQIHLNQAINLECQINNPNVQFEWTRSDGRPIGKHFQGIRSNILKTNKAEEGDAGRYFCRVNDGRKSAVAEAIVSVSIANKIFVTIQHPKEQRILVDQDARFVCRAFSQLQHTISWSRKDGRPLPSNAVDDNNGLLEISKVRIHDEGIYICTAYARSTSASDEAQLIVAVDALSPSARVEPGRVFVTRGNPVELNCRAVGSPPLNVSWTRRNGEALPPHMLAAHDSSILKFSQVTEEDAGEYICTVSNPWGVVRSAGQLYVETEVNMHVDVSNRQLELRSGAEGRLMCQSIGGYSSPVKTIHWTRRDANMPQSSYQKDGLLVIPHSSEEDSGLYICLIKYLDGHHEIGYSTIVVYKSDDVHEFPPEVEIEPDTLTIEEGGTGSLHCLIRNAPVSSVLWSKGHEPLTSNHIIRGTTLTIQNALLKDRGYYICHAETLVGRAYATAIVIVNERQKYRQTSYPFAIQIQPENLEAKLGDNVQLDCQVSGVAEPQIQWLRENNLMPRNSHQNLNILRFENIQIMDAGTYVCRVSSNGQFLGLKKSIFIVNDAEDKDLIETIELPTMLANKQVRSFALNSNATVRCPSKGFPQPIITWKKKTGNMPLNYVAYGNILIINPIELTDFGEYICEAKNQHGSAQSSIRIQKLESVLRFTQQQLSYSAFSPIKDAYNDVDIDISFKPEKKEGLLLFAQQEITGSDFILLSVRDSKIELRMDMGSGPMILLTETIQLNVWHNIRFRKLARNVYMILDGEEYTRNIEGRFTGLDITSNLYMGGFPNFRSMLKSAAFNNSFEGCISRLKVNGVVISLTTDSIDSRNVSECDECTANVCLNGGFCTMGASKVGYQCECQLGYSGDTCQKKGADCIAGECEFGEICHITQNSYICVCPLGTYGLYCQSGDPIIIPSFDVTSYIALVTPVDVLRHFQMTITLKLFDLKDALIIYSSYHPDGSGDFVALLIRNSKLEFKFDLGSGVTTIIGDDLTIDKWIKIMLNVYSKEGSLQIDGGTIIKSNANGTSVGLNIRTPLYIGCVNLNETMVSKYVAKATGFSGSISKISIKGKDIDFSNDVLESFNIKEYEDIQLYDNEYTIDDDLNIELNDAPASLEIEKPVPLPDRKYISQKIVGSKNVRSIIKTPIEGSSRLTLNTKNTDFLKLDQKTVLSFNFGMLNGYVEMRSDLIDHLNSTLYRDILSFSFTTICSNGILMFQGSKHSEKEFFAIYMNNGYLILSFDNGSGVQSTSSLVKLNNGKEHSVSFRRMNERCILRIDSMIFDKKNKELNKKLNLDGSIYIGGLPNPNITSILCTESFVGTIHDVVMKSTHSINLKNDILKLSHVNITQMHIQKPIEYNQFQNTNLMYVNITHSYSIRSRLLVLNKYLNYQDKIKTFKNILPLN